MIRSVTHADGTVSGAFSPPPSCSLGAPLLLERIDKQSQPYPVKSVTAEMLTLHENLKHHGAADDASTIDPNVRLAQPWTEGLYLPVEAHQGHGNGCFSHDGAICNQIEPLIT